MEVYRCCTACEAYEQSNQQTNGSILRLMAVGEIKFVGSTSTASQLLLQNWVMIKRGAIE